MAVSKRLRYEILRRDNHTCRYCGAKAPDVEITVDHVIPTALGGTDDPSNLVAACRDCNGGKTSSSPDAPLVADIADRALEWAQAMRQAQAGMLADIQAREADRRQFAEWWDSWGRGTGPHRYTFPKDPGWELTVDQFVSAGLPLAALKDCIDRAMTRKHVTDANKFRYMCGVAWGKVTDLQKAARAIVGISAGSDEEETDPAIVRGRADLARELLGDLDPEDIEVLLEEAREDWQATTDDEQHIAAAHIAWQSARTDLSWLAFSVCELLPGIPGEPMQTALRQARAELYDEDGEEFSRAAFAQRAADIAMRRYEEQAAADYLSALPADERAEWELYAASVHDRELRGRWALLSPARCAKAIKGGGGPWRYMCNAWGEHIRYCSSRATRNYRFNELQCCKESGNEHDYHQLCEEHSKMAEAGELRRGDQVVTVESWSPVVVEEEKAPF